MSITTYNNDKGKWQIKKDRLTDGVFHITCISKSDGETYVKEVDGYCFVENGWAFILHKDILNPKKWNVTDYYSGMRICSDRTREKTARKFDVINEDDKIVEALHDAVVEDKHYKKLARMNQEAYLNDAEKRTTILREDK